VSGDVRVNLKDGFRFKANLEVKGFGEACSRRRIEAGVTGS
jgi:hypothetical protein